MQAYQISQLGGVEELRLTELPTPQPGPGQVLVKVAAAGINYADILQRLGTYPAPVTLPFVPGLEVAGTVAGAGPGAESWPVGQRVMALVPSGGYADYALADAAQVIPVPDELSFAEATALLVQGLTAMGLLNTGHYASVLVLAATGGVGSLLVQAAKNQGRFVVAAVGSEAKRAEALALGADAAVAYDAPDWVAQARAASPGGQGLAASFDAVGGAVGAAALTALAPGGAALIYGAASGAPTMLAAQSLIGTGRSVRGYTLYADLAQAPAYLAELVGYHRAGRLQLPLAAYPFAQAQAAHRDMEGRRTQGKVVLVLTD